MISLVRSVCFLLLLGLVFNISIQKVFAGSCSVYVATNGSDSASGTSASPFATIAKAQATAGPGDTVCIRSGTYTASKSTISSVGTANSPILFTKDPASSGSVILDGAGSAVTQGQAVLTLYKASYVTVDGLEIRNSPFDGLDVENSTNVTVSNNKIHDTQTAASVIDGTNIIYKNNEVYNAAMKNVNHAFGTGGWPGVVQTYAKPDGSATANVQFIDNYIHDSWGEGLIAATLNGGVIQGNTIRDTFSVLMYLVDLQNVTVDGNYLSISSNKYTNSNGKVADGILLAQEPHSFGPYILDSNITISNNIVLGSDHGISFWHDTDNTNASNSYTNIRVYYNTVKDTKTMPIWFDTVGSGYTTPSGNELKNNIIGNGADGTSLSVGNPTAWTFSHNDWINGIPTLDSVGNGSFAANPLFVAPATSGGPYAATADGYKLQLSSAASAKGIPVSVTTDYYGTTRPANPDLGFAQSGTGTTSTVAPTQANTISPTQIQTASPTVSPTPSGTGPTPTSGIPIPPPPPWFSQAPQTLQDYLIQLYTLIYYFHRASNMGYLLEGIFPTPTP